MIGRGIPPLAVLFVLASPAWLNAQPFDWRNPPQGTFIDEWLVVEFAGGKVGHAHNTVTREEDQIRSRTTVTMTIGRAGAQIKIDKMDSAVETLNGTPLEFDSYTDMSQMRIVHRGTVRDGKVNLVSTQFNQESRQTVDYPSGALMAWGLLRKQYEMGLAEGTKYDVGMYLPADMPFAAIQGTVEIAGRESVQVQNASVSAIKMTTTLSMPMVGRMTMIGWVDDDGTVLISEVPIPGMGSMRMVRADKETALKAAEPPEFFMQTLVTVDREIDRQKANTIRYRLSLKDPSATFPTLPTTGMQTPAAVTGNSVVLTVARQDHAALTSAPTTPANADLEEYLASNAMMNLDDPELVAMAKTAAGGEKHPYKLADKLRRYVTEVIKDKNLNIGFATATEVCRNKEGDCSEHGVLLAALGRANGLPSRVVTGLVYVPTFKETDRVFGFHMWTQFFINGQWVDFDAAQRETDCNPTHIAINVSSLKGGSLVDASFALMGILGQLKIEVLEVVPSPAG